MDREFIDFKQALALKELGFDEPSIKFYWTDGMFVKDFVNPFNYNKRDSAISAPLYQQAFRWFRKKYNIVSSVRTHFNEEFFYEIYVDVMNEITSNYYKTYEEAELGCIEKLIELTKNK
jgi:hypothetical protein